MMNNDIVYAIILKCVGPLVHLFWTLVMQVYWTVMVGHDANVYALEHDVCICFSLDCEDVYLF